MTFVDKLREHGIEVHPMVYFTPLNLLKLIYLRYKGYNIIHLHWSYIFPFKWFWHLFNFYTRVLGFKKVLTVHSLEPFDPKDAEVNRLLHDGVDMKFLNHRSHVALLEERGMSTENISHVFHPGFYLYRKDLSKKEARRILGIPMNKKVSLALGWIKRYKGLEYFIDAIKILGGNHKGLIVGEALDKKYLQELRDRTKGSAKNIWIIDEFIPKDNVQIYVNACDVVVIPYTYNIWTSGQVMLAYGFAKPVVGSNVGSMPEVVDKTTGILVKPSDSEALAEGIKKIYKMDYKKMGQDALQLVLVHYNWDDMIEIMKKEYIKLLEKGV